MLLRLRLLALAALFLSAPAFAQEEPATRARILANNTLIEDGHFWAGVEFTLPKGWHIYWQNPGDSGIPPSFTWTLPAGMKAGPIHWPVPERQPMGDLVNYGYAGRVVLPVPIEAGGADTRQGELEVKADWLICKDICIPQSAELRYDLAQSSAMKDSQRLKSALYKVPEPYEGEAYITADREGVTLALALPVGTGGAELFPVDDGWFKNNATPRTETRGSWTLFHLPRGHAEPGDRFSGVLAPAGKAHPIQFTAQHVDALPDSIPEPQTGFEAFALALVLAFLGGMILNLMPCVLPVLALKALSLSKKSDIAQGEAVRLGLAYMAGVLLSFAAIGAALLALKAGGEAIGWGFQLQSPGFVLGLALIVSLVAFNLIGLFELPVLLGGVGHALTSRHNKLGAFATGALAVALATPCTAPFMAPALGVALTLPPAQAMAIFLALGLGLALPYMLVSSSAWARRHLPKPGAWMQRFRELLAFPMFATAGWLLWVLSEQVGGIGLLMGFTVLLLVALALWGLKHARRRLWRMVFWAVLAGAIGWAVLCPPRIGDVSATLASEAFTPARLEALRDEGRPVFVDATAAWCVTCKYNERAALQVERTAALFEKHGITLLVADWTKRDADITAWLASFGRSGVPLYVYYPPEGAPRVLPQLLTPAIVEEAIAGTN